MLTLPTGVEIGYRDWGGSGPPLVLAHGLGSSLHMWDYAAPLLARHFHVVAYDQRGHASSSKPDRGYNLDTMVEDLRGLISGLGLERPVVVGHSWGALIALAYAGEEGSRCPGVGLVDGGVIDIRGIPGLTWETMERDLNPPA